MAALHIQHHVELTGTACLQLPRKEMGDRILPTWKISRARDLPESEDGCSGLISVTIPDGVTTIGRLAFFDCSRVASVTIPEGVTSIGEDAFHWWTGLTSVSIPKGVTTIGEYAFYGCTKLTSVIIPEGASIGNHAFYNCTDLTSVTFLKGVTSIGDSAFSMCTALTSVIILEGVTSIGHDAFSDCSALTSVTIPKGVTTMGERVFYDCKSLITAIISEGTVVGDYIFPGCHHLSYVIAPASLRESPGDYFDDCPLLAKLEPDTERNRLEVLRMQYWSASTHRLCTEQQHEWVVLMLLVVQRLRSRDSQSFPVLPIEMWLMILGFLPRWAHGEHV